MKTFVISLQRAVERRKLIKDQLDAIQLPFEFFNAFDGEALDAEFMAKHADSEVVAKWPEFLNPGAVGCALSHYTIYKRMVEEDIDVALVMEDDVVVSPSLRKVLADVSLYITPNDLIMLYFQSSQMVEISSQKTEKVDQNYSLHYLVKHGYIKSTVAYVVTKPVAKRLLHILFPIQTVADDWCKFKRQEAFNKFRCVLPFPVQPAGLKSAINYLDQKPIAGRVSSVIDKYTIFPFKQILARRRKAALSNMQEYVIVDKDPFSSEDSLNSSLQTQLHSSSDAA